MLISQSALIRVCLGLGLLQWAYSAFLCRHAARLLSRSGAKSWPAATVIIECALGDEGSASRVRALLSEPYPGKLEFRLHAPGSDAEALRRFAGEFSDERLRPGASSWAAAAGARADVLLWVGRAETLSTDWLKRRLAELPTHAVEVDGAGVRLTAIQDGWAGLLQLAGLRGELPLNAVLAYLPAGWKAENGAPFDVRASPLLSAKNLWVLSARIAVWRFFAAAAVGAVCNVYFLFWALRSWPSIRWGLVEAVLLVVAVGSAVLAESARRFLRLGASRCIKLQERAVRAEFQGRGRVLGGLVAEHVPAGSAVLDVGAADGLLLDFLRKRRRAKTSGIDVVPMACGGAPVRAYDGETIDARDGSADVVLAVYTLHHCTQPDRVLREIRRVTKGRLILIEDAYGTLFDKVLVQTHHLGMRLILGMGWNVSGFGNADAWSARLAQAGFRVLECRKIPRSLRDHLVCDAYLIVATVA